VVTEFPRGRFIIPLLFVPSCQVRVHFLSERSDLTRDSSSLALLKMTSAIPFLSFRAPTRNPLTEITTLYLHPANMSHPTNGCRIKSGMTLRFFVISNECEKSLFSSRFLVAMLLEMTLLKQQYFVCHSGRRPGIHFQRSPLLTYARPICHILRMDAGSSPA